jgi:hypothetical protein
MREMSASRRDREEWERGHVYAVEIMAAEEWAGGQGCCCGNKGDFTGGEESGGGGQGAKREARQEGGCRRGGGRDAAGGRWEVKPGGIIDFTGTHGTTLQEWALILILKEMPISMYVKV